MDNIRFTTSFIKTNVSAIKVLNNLILIAMGSYLIIYDRKTHRVIQRFYVFEQMITGIEFYDSKILIYGETVISLFELRENIQISTMNTFVYNDWILSAKFISSGKEIAFVSMHSEALLLNDNFTLSKTSKSTEICTCYCAHIACETWENLYILSGTAFSEILIWKPSIRINGKSPILHKLKGHKGVIFSIDFSKDLQTICSTSDDGKAFLWSVKNIFDEITPSKEIQHRQRVFKCKFFKETLVTALEDSTFKIWNCKLNFQQKSGTHQIGPIWCIDFCSTENVVFTGGADGGVISSPLQDFKHYKINNTLKESWRYKDLVLLNQEIAVGITSLGNLNLINTKSDRHNHELIETHEDMNSYGIIEKSNCGKLVCLGGMYGNIHLYRFKNGELHYEVSCKIKSNPKIFSLHWLSCKTFLTCITNGILILWYFDGENLTPIQLFELPLTKERWSTSATYCGTNNIVVGDRKGNLYLYNIEENYPVQVLKKIQPMGVTKLYFNQKTGRIVVLGRNALLHKYYLDVKQQRLSLITKDKLPFSWLGAYCMHEDKEIILGFSNDKFIVWNHTSRRNIFEDSCGGGHRLWDFHLDRDKFTLIYQKVDKLTSIEFNLGDEVRNIIEGFHGTETNSMKLIKISDDPFCCISISGGEDTTLRLCKFDFNNTLNEFSLINTVKSHLSSVRVVVYHKILGDNERYFIFSAGGRAQIILWELNVLSTHDVVLKEIYSYYKNLEEYESEIRVMDLVTAEIDEAIILFAACSDGSVKLYKINPNNPEIIYVRTIFHKERCILKLFILKVADFDFLVTSCTDGKLTFLNITNLLVNTESIIDVPIITSIKTNQSGINSCSFCHISRNQVVILTGGDDKAFTLSLIECTFLNSVEISLLSSYTNESFHFAHITGAYITDNYFITASIDQKVIIYRWKIENQIDFKVEAIHKRYTSVTDLQGIDYLENYGKIELVLFGNGFEIFTISLE